MVPVVLLPGMRLNALSDLPGVLVTFWCLDHLHGHRCIAPKTLKAQGLPPDLGAPGRNCATRLTLFAFYLQFSGFPP